MKNKTVFVACDTSNLKKIKKIINQTKTKKLKIIPKFGLQFFYSKHGRKFLENIKSDFWLDLKINDIPQTALSAIDSLKDLKKCKYITVHANGGLEMLKAVKKEARKINGERVRDDDGGGRVRAGHDGRLRVEVCVRAER